MNRDKHSFLPGQRWLSDTEAELGLGSVLATDDRAVQVAFPATGETRMYALRGAPLTRVEMHPGDRIRDRAGRELTVTAAHQAEGLFTYACEDLDGRVHQVTEAELDDRLRLNRPRERLLSGRIDRDDWFTLRYQTWRQMAAEARSPVRGLVGARVALVPHQLYIAAQVASRYAPRVLLADEVGLGKTIEAGLILHRLLLGGRVRRVLLVVPEALMHQWLVEMLRRFNLRFALLDQERIEAAGDDNAFLQEQCVLCALELLAADPATAGAALAGEWDMLVVDEAHRLAWSEAGASPEYALVEGLARATPGVLLLTATPEQLGRAGHFGRLRLLDPHRYHDYAVFLAEEEHYAPVAALAARLLDGQTPTGEDRNLLQALLGEAAGANPGALVDALLDRHGAGRVLLRNTRAAVPGFALRLPVPQPLSLPAAYTDLDADPVDLLTPEVAYGAGWTDVDPRVPWLEETLLKLRPRKVLVICARAETALALREALRRRRGTRAAVFHEGMEILERDRAAAWFAEPEEGAQVLVCSEIGSEGRNFQFAHHLVLFDLPLDPDLLEQRIGRLDRIGQTESVRIHLPYLEGGPGEVLYRWYAEGLNAFAAVCPAAGAVQAKLKKELAAALAEPARGDALVAEAARLAERLNGDLEAGRDRLLELSSHRPAVSAPLVQAIERQDAERRVNDYMTRYWDGYGVEQDPGPDQTAVLHPGDHMLHEFFPSLPEDGLTVTFDRLHALAHEDREFLTWEHPMVRGAMDLLTGSDLGSSAVSVLKDPRLAAGTLLLEQIYVAECPAPPDLEAGRFLPPTALRVLIDVRGRDLASELPHESLRGDCLSRNRTLAQALLRSQTGRLREMLSKGEALAHQAALRLATDARTDMDRLLGAELERLRALAQVNPSVRAEELEHIENRRTRLAAHLGKTQARLDALRVVVNG